MIIPDFIFDNPQTVFEETVRTWAKEANDILESAIVKRSAPKLHLVHELYPDDGRINRSFTQTLTVPYDWVQMKKGISLLPVTLTVAADGSVTGDGGVFDIMGQIYFVVNGTVYQSTTGKVTGLAAGSYTATLYPFATGKFVGNTWGFSKVLEDY